MVLLDSLTFMHYFYKNEKLTEFLKISKLWRNVDIFNSYANWRTWLCQSDDENDIFFSKYFSSISLVF